MFLVGLTGGISTGKSTVSRLLADLHCPVIDADLIAREVVEPGTNGWRKIREKFGPSVFHENGELNREKLGEIIFSDPEKRKLLNSITHPEIYKVMLWKLFVFFLKGHQFVILDLPLLFESAKMLPYMSYAIVVSCSSDQQLSRLMSRNSYSKEEAVKRINSQIPLEEKCRQATDIINNSGTIEDTQRQVMELYGRLRRSHRHYSLRILLLSITTVSIGIIYYFIAAR